jgi:hypothetical protein
MRARSTDGRGSAADPSHPTRVARPTASPWSAGNPRAPLAKASSRLGRLTSTVQNDSSLYVKTLFGCRLASSDSGCEQTGESVVGWCRVREWLVRRAGVRGVSRPRWRQSRSSVALPGPLMLIGWPVRRRTPAPWSGRRAPLRTPHGQVSPDRLRCGPVIGSSPVTHSSVGLLGSRWASPGWMLLTTPPGRARPLRTHPPAARRRRMTRHHVSVEWRLDKCWFAF